LASGLKYPVEAQRGGNPFDLKLHHVVLGELAVALGL
jgi:hypothetical protein